MCLSCFLKDVNVQPTTLIQKFCKNEAGYVVRSQPRLTHIFSELYTVPESIRKGYFKVKILELLLFLSSMSLDDDMVRERSYSGNQVTLAKDAGRYLAQHMDRRVTIDELAEQFYVYPTAMKIQASLQKPLKMFWASRQMNIETPQSEMSVWSRKCSKRSRGKDEITVN